MLLKGLRRSYQAHCSSTLAIGGQQWCGCELPWHTVLHAIVELSGFGKRVLVTLHGTEAGFGRDGALPVRAAIHAVRVRVVSKATRPRVVCVSDVLIRRDRLGERGRGRLAGHG
ncbi:hypothetical protein BU26DRAFT_225780 [Trematosphaeria pertusa]|uniref:Uncharacterized protein n=1 Tax=Trematosphaeria pertusa TaxID=390896 RepID=A0A6A6ITE7_9PLEO|nr:uncharacterized protein BU26DRAFT_225780 [Trematosphaeria pertusa]KAF2253599.1 hypothetical protein BU26DRAFT_225780 [Trematosphaeria pertusa]